MIAPNRRGRRPRVTACWPSGLCPRCSGRMPSRHGRANGRGLRPVTRGGRDVVRASHSQIPRSWWSPPTPLKPSMTAVSSRRCGSRHNDAGEPRRPELVHRRTIPVVPSRMRDQERARIAGFAMRREFTSRGCRAGPRGGSDPDRRHEGRVRETSRAAVGLINGPGSAPGRQVPGRSCINIPAAARPTRSRPSLCLRSRAGGDDGPSHRGRTGCRRARHPPSHVPICPTAMARCSTSRRAAIGRLMRGEVARRRATLRRPRAPAPMSEQPATSGPCEDRHTPSAAFVGFEFSTPSARSRRGDRQPMFRPSGRDPMIDLAVRF
jgi:hypothetical protein